MATIWPAPGGGAAPVAPDNFVADAVDAMVSFG